MSIMKEDSLKYCNSKAASLVVLALLMVTLKLAFDDHENSRPRTFIADFLQQSAVRFPNESRPRRMGPGRTFSAALLHEGNINMTTIDLTYGEVRPALPHGVGTHLFLHLGTYRNSPREFVAVGDISREVDDYSHPQFGCTWVAHNGTTAESKDVTKQRVGWYHGLYDPLVVTCKFGADVGVDGHGGSLWLAYWMNDKYRSPERFVAMTERSGEYKGEGSFEPPFEYEVVYCGSPIFGNVSAERVREWLAYHMFVMGERAHFILYDGGGFHEEVQAVVRPWVEKGRVSVQNIRQMVSLYHGYYFHQFTVVNDCLFKSQFMANWTFFFDVDEYLFVDPVHNLTKYLDALAAEGVTQIKYENKPMSISLCANATRDPPNAKLWSIEKFIFNMHWRGESHANKYAVQARYMQDTGVHSSRPKWGSTRSLSFDRDHLWFYHYHGSISEHGETCRDFIDPASATRESPFNYSNENYSADFTLANLAEEVRRFEIAAIGDIQPFLL